MERVLGYGHFNYIMESKDLKCVNSFNFFIKESLMKNIKFNYFYIPFYHLLSKAYLKEIIRNLIMIKARYKFKKMIDIWNKLIIESKQNHMK